MMKIYNPKMRVRGIAAARLRLAVTWLTSAGQTPEKYVILAR
jgi:hypothetical protein